jgi:hypothetical protein
MALRRSFCGVKDDFKFQIWRFQSRKGTCFEVVLHSFLSFCRRSAAWMGANFYPRLAPWAIFWRCSAATNDFRVGGVAISNLKFEKRHSGNIIFFWNFFDHHVKQMSLRWSLIGFWFGVLQRWRTYGAFSDLRFEIGAEGDSRTEPSALL